MVAGNWGNHATMATMVCEAAIFLNFMVAGLVVAGATMATILHDHGRKK